MTFGIWAVLRALVVNASVIAGKESFQLIPESRQVRAEEGKAAHTQGEDTCPNRLESFDYLLPRQRPCHVSLV